MQILICVGTRPEAIKIAPICYELKKRQIPFKLCLTGQHRALLDQVISFFELNVDYDLNLMEKNQSLNLLSAKILEKTDGILATNVFDMVMVHGDTTTSVMVALAAFNRNIKIIHIEAGLRTYNKLAPFPEEMNRQLTGRLADYHMAPTKKAEKNLLSEGRAKEDVLVTGNSVIDALQFTMNKLTNGYTTKSIDSLKKDLDFNKKIILVTGHRRENFGKGFDNICNALIELSQKKIQIVFPVHFNPNVRNVVYERLSGLSNIILIEPLDYPSFVWLMQKSNVIISDSGGVQEEAPTFNIPVIVTRDVTEREEGIHSGHSILVGTDKDKIVRNTLRVLQEDYNKSLLENPYGKGNSSMLIVDFIKEQTKTRNS